MIVLLEQTNDRMKRQWEGSDQMIPRLCDQIDEWKTREGLRGGIGRRRTY